MNHSPDTSPGVEAAGRPGAAELRRQLILATPAYVLVPIALSIAMLGLGADLQPIAVVAGAVGWLVALVLRAPVALAALNRTGSRERAQPWIVGSSGPLEELVRLAVLLIVGRELDVALSVGLGWAGIEVVYAIVNGFALATLAGRTDPEAEQAKAMLPSQAALEANSPWWGVLERLWASLLHVGFTLIVAAQPILVVLTMIVHSAANLGLIRALGAGISLARVQVAGLVLAGAVLGAAALLWRPV